MTDATIIPFPERKPERNINRELLYIELESLERRAEDIKRQLGILATEEGLE